jgi:hypothetical protein
MNLSYGSRAWDSKKIADIQRDGIQSLTMIKCKIGKKEKVKCEKYG